MTKYLLILLLFISCGEKYKNPHVEIRTAIGTVELELFPDQAPKTVAAFLSYVDGGLYQGASFYRVLNVDNQPSNAPKAELIQGGLYGRRGKKEQPGIEHETTDKTKIKHTNGVISLARLQPGTASTEFFICIGDQPGLDFGGENNPDGQGYAAFGKVVKGMDVVRKIYAQPEENQYFSPRVAIANIVRL